MRASFTFVSAYLILRRGDEVLLLKRQNTGYRDGDYGVVSGHVEEGEPATRAIVREAMEEAGNEIYPGGLRGAHIMHCKTNRTDIAIFFECRTWKGEVKNLEPEKCTDLSFFPLQALPMNTIEQVAAALHAISQDNFYSESGWHEHDLCKNHPR